MRAGWAGFVVLVLLAGCTAEGGKGPPPLPEPSVMLAAAPADRGTTATFRTLATTLPKGRITGLSGTGVAVGYEGKPWDGVVDFRARVPHRTPVTPDLLPERPVWFRDGRAVRLPPVYPPHLSVPAGEPRVSPGGLVGRVNGLGWFDGRRPERQRTDTGGLPPGAAASVLLDLDDAGRLLVRALPENPMAKPGQTGYDDLLIAPDGTRTRLGMEGFRLLPGGAVAGTVVTDAGTAARAPAVWRDGNVTRLPMPPGTLDLRAARGGVLAGKVTTGPEQDSRSRAVAWRDGRAVDLQSLGGEQSIAVAIGPDGTVAGTSQTGDGVPHAVVWDAAGRVTDLGTITGGAESWATGIDGSGEDRVVVGWSERWPGSRSKVAVAWTARGITDLGAAVPGGPATRADGITGRQVYGVAGDRPAIWTLTAPGSG